MLNRQGGSCDVGLLRTVHLAWPVLLQDFPNLLIKVNWIIFKYKWLLCRYYVPPQDACGVMQ